jgi:hypothetical protein
MHTIPQELPALANQLMLAAMAAVGFASGLGNERALSGNLRPPFP